MSDSDELNLVLVKESSGGQDGIHNEHENHEIAMQEKVLQQEDSPMPLPKGTSKETKRKPRPLSIFFICLLLFVHLGFNFFDKL